MTDERKLDVVSIGRSDVLSGIETMVGKYLTHKFKPHAHAEFVIGLIDEGVHSVWCRGEHHFATASTIVTMHPGDIHHGGAAEENGWVQRMIYVDETVMAEMTSDNFGRQPGSLPNFKQTFWAEPNLAEAFKDLHKVVHSSPLTLARDSALQALLQIVLGHLSPSLVQESGFRRAPASMSAVRDYLHANANNDVSLSELCGISGLGRRQTIDAFKRHFGLPPHAYHLILKVNSAKRLLIAGVSTAEVAATVGFADQSHLTRHFRAIVGATPGAYKTAA